MHRAEAKAYAIKSMALVVRPGKASEADADSLKAITLARTKDAHSLACVARAYITSECAPRSTAEYSGFLQDGAVRRQKQYPCLYRMGKSAAKIRAAEKGKQPV